jgi:Nbl1 / Borealin N terminal
MQRTKFSPEQKQQLLSNLDIEGNLSFSRPTSFCLTTLPVAHRTRQLESWLSDTLAAFRNRHERQLAKIPHLVRGMTMAEFGDKYDGDVQAALRGLQKERLTVDVAPIDRNAMKRKWAPPPEENPETRSAGSGKDPDNGQARAAKNRA